MRQETKRVSERYAKRSRTYDHLDPAVYMSRQELERALIKWVKKAGFANLSEVSLIEIGCGTGSNLAQFQRLGFSSENLVGNELLPDRVMNARESLPDSIKILAGDALDLDIADSSFDVVFQSLVFTSLLDDDYQNALALKLWRIVKPGGGLLWYDFVYNNPSNKDVRGIPLARVLKLFPEGIPSFQKITLAPPISRRVARFYPPLYSVFNCLPFLRTHILCWLQKPLQGP